MHVVGRRLSGHGYQGQCTCGAQSNADLDYYEVNEWIEIHMQWAVFMKGN